MKSRAVIVFLALPFLLIAKVWKVGPGEFYTKPSEVSTLVHDGDTVLILASEYKKDVCIWRANNLRLIGIGGKAHLNAENTSYGGKAIWVIAGDNTYVENIEFSNCTVIDLNGAGIRLEGKNLHVRSCYFHHNQDGILAGDNIESDVIIEHSEFGYNGAGNGFSHNIYINHLRSLLFQYNYVHHANYGHEVKSRAHKNTIMYNRITNEDGDASYEIDIPNGGPCLILGNVIQQSKYSGNNSMISYGREGLTNPVPHNLYFIHNTIVNHEDKGTVLSVQLNTDTVLNANNIFAGPMSILVGIPKKHLNINNVIRSDISQLHFMSNATYDFRLTPQSPGLDSAIKLNQNYPGFSMTPDKEYLHPMTWKNRFNDKLPDIGAFELQQITRNDDPHHNHRIGYYQQHTKTFVFTNETFDGSPDRNLQVFNAEGKLLFSEEKIQSTLVNFSHLQLGFYFYTIKNQQQLLSGSFVVTH